VFSDDALRLVYASKQYWRTHGINHVLPVKSEIRWLAFGQPRDAPNDWTADSFMVLNDSHSMMLGTKLARDQSKNSVGTADVCLVRLPPWASHFASRVIEAAS